MRRRRPSRAPGPLKPQPMEGGVAAKPGGCAGWARRSRHPRWVTVCTLSSRSRSNKHCGCSSDRTGIKASVAIVVGLERPVLLDGEVLRLLGGELGQLGADLREVQRGDLLVQM